MNDSTHKKNKKKTPLGALWNVLSWIIISILAFFAIALVGIRLTGLFTPYVILSPSMTPQYQVGDLIYVKECPPEQVKKGDVLTFTLNENALIVTHRVVDIDHDNRHFITKGDANSNNDSVPVPYEDMLGVVRFSIPKLGHLSNFLTSPSGRYVCIALIFVLLLMTILPELKRKEQKR